MAQEGEQHAVTGAGLEQEIGGLARELADASAARVHMHTRLRHQVRRRGGDIGERGGQLLRITSFLKPTIASTSRCQTPCSAARARAMSSWPGTSRVMSPCTGGALGAGIGAGGRGGGGGSRRLSICRFSAATSSLSLLTSRSSAER